MSNKLLFQEEPIFVKTFEDFQKYCQTHQSKQSFKANCPVCGKEIHFLKNWPCNRRKNLLCEIHLRRQNIVERWGSKEAYLKNWSGKVKETNLKKFGVDNIFKDKRRIQKAVEQKYGEGITCCGLIKDAHKKQKQTMLEKHGVSSVFQIQEIYEKISTAAWSPEARQKRKDTCKKRYGCEVPPQSTVVKEKAKNTCLKNWGRIFGGNSQKAFYFYEEKYFDSSWELAYYIWLKDQQIDFEYHTKTLEYFVNGEKHKYEVDFVVNGVLVEIKGRHLLGENGNLVNPFHDNQTTERLKAKSDCMRENGVKIISDDEIKVYLNYISTKYGKDFLQSFRVKYPKDQPIF